MADAIDGRTARRRRNIDTVLDTVIELFSEDALFPTVEQVAERSGVSLRSIYRYFPDPAELHDAAIRRQRERSRPLAQIEHPGEGPLSDRIEALVAARLRLYEGIGAAWRAAVHHAVRHPRFRDRMERNRQELREQFEEQFAPELSALRGAERLAATEAGDLLTQLESIDHLRRHRRLSVAEATEVLRRGLTSVLVPPRS